MGVWSFREKRFVRRGRASSLEGSRRAFPKARPDAGDTGGFRALPLAARSNRDGTGEWERGKSLSLTKGKEHARFVPVHRERLFETASRRFERKDARLRMIISG
jgi:hypothetical protein